MTPASIWHDSYYLKHVTLTPSSQENFQYLFVKLVCIDAPFKASTFVSDTLCLSLSRNNETLTRLRCYSSAAAEERDGTSSDTGADDEDYEDDEGRYDEECANCHLRTTELSFGKFCKRNFGEILTRNVTILATNSWYSWAVVIPIGNCGITL